MASESKAGALTGIAMKPFEPPQSTKAALSAVEVKADVKKSGQGAFGSGRRDVRLLCRADVSHGAEPN
jgi:hypothetical protein